MPKIISKNFSGFSAEQISLFRKLNSPQRIQDFLENIPINFAETCWSPKKVLEERKAHCLEGALFGAAALRFHGHRPLVIDLQTTEDDENHVLAVFKQNGCWGALSKTNHGVLRYRDPIFRNIRELMLSFFNEYFLNDGKKTLRSYSRLVNLSRFDKFGWMTSEKSVDFIDDYLEEVKHLPILTKKMIASLRKADPIEIKSSEIVQWERK